MTATVLQLFEKSCDFQLFRKICCRYGEEWFSARHHLIVLRQTYRMETKELFKLHFSLSRKSSRARA